MAETKNKYAVVTGSNKGIGFEICRQLASQGITVVVTARDEKRGLEALEKLKGFGLSDFVIFHHLDVSDPPSIASFAQFIQSHFGKLDILINNAGIGGALIDEDAFRAAAATGVTIIEYGKINWSEMMSESYESALGCIQTNYYGAKLTTEALLPLLHLSSSPRIVNVSSSMGKLKINNAGIGGAQIDEDAFRAAAATGVTIIEYGKINWSEMMSESYESALGCIQTNYYGAKLTTEALLPLLHLSSSPRIVNVSSSMGKLKKIQNEWAKGVLNDVEGLTKERIDEVLNEFLRDLKEGVSQAKGWPHYMAAYTVSKAAMNAYTRLLAKKNPSFRINCVCPGYVRTDINFNTGVLTAEEGAECPVMAALLPDEGPSGLFFVKKEVSSFEE